MRDGRWRRDLLATTLLAIATGACTMLQEAAPPDQPPQAASSGYDGGFFLRSEDGANELLVEGLLQTVAGVYDGDRDPSADIELKRMRPELSGKLADALRFRIEPKFTEDEVELEEAWAGTDVWGGEALLMIGRMKAPFNLEEVRSRRHIDFPLFSVINQFAPAEDHGFFLNGQTPSGVWEYGFALYNGTGESDTTSSKDVAARVMVHPFAEEADSAWRDLGLGLAATIGNQDEDVAGDSIENGIGLDMTTYAPGATLDGRRWRAGLEAVWFHGPWMLQGELLTMSQEMSSPADEADVAFRGGYVTVSHVLTGESKSFKGVVPDEPYDFKTGRGRGAWVAAVRLSSLSLDDDLDDAGLVEPGTFTDRNRNVSLALNWIANQHAIVRTALIHSRYDDAIDLGDGSDDKETALLVEFQLHF
jgi:phosphate-selective porin OprO/OprP